MGLSVYFAHPWGPNWILEGPDRSRASYQLGYGYLQRMIRNRFAESICAGDVFLLEGDLIVVEEHVYEETPWGSEHLGYTLPVYATGSDGEPLIENPRILTRLDVWGGDPALPTLFCCGTSYDWSYEGRRRRAKPLMDTLDHQGREDWCLDWEISEPEENPTSRNPVPRPPGVFLVGDVVTLRQLPGRYVVWQIYDHPRKIPFYQVLPLDPHSLTGDQMQSLAAPMTPVQVTGLAARQDLDWPRDKSGRELREFFWAQKGRFPMREHPVVKAIHAEGEDVLGIPAPRPTLRFVPNPRYRRNADERVRRIEREAKAGSPEALDRLYHELKRVHEFDPGLSWEILHNTLVPMDEEIARERPWRTWIMGVYVEWKATGVRALPYQGVKKLDRNRVINLLVQDIPAYVSGDDADEMGGEFNEILDRWRRKGNLLTAYFSAATQIGGGFDLYCDTAVEVLEGSRGLYIPEPYKCSVMYYAAQDEDPYHEFLF
jgi:hypothetical protein